MKRRIALKVTVPATLTSVMCTKDRTEQNMLFTMFWCSWMRLECRLLSCPALIHSIQQSTTQEATPDDLIGNQLHLWRKIAPHGFWNVIFNEMISSEVLSVNQFAMLSHSKCDEFQKKSDFPQRRKSFEENDHLCHVDNMLGASSTRSDMRTHWFSQLTW